MVDSAVWAKIGFTVNLLVDQIGTALFIPMVYVIVKYKKLHDSCCLKLIGIFMFACLCSKFIIILPYFIRVLPLLNVPLILCFAIQIVPFVIVTNIIPVTLAMACDRCCSIFFPIWYRNEQKRLYFVTLGLLFVATALHSLIPISKNVFFHPMSQTNCTTGELYGSQGFVGLPDLGSYMNYLTILFYLLMVVKLVWDGRDGRKAYFKRQPIFVSFAVTIFIQVVGTWLITFAYRYIPGLFSNLSGDQMSLVYYGINCLSSLLTTIQFWGIYMTSAEHRMALKAEFPRMFRFFPMKGVQYAFCGATCSSTTTQVKPFATQQQIKNNTSMANP